MKHSVGADKINEVVNSVANDIVGDYPIFDEEYRGVLNAKILKHYYTREIGEETVGLWKFRLNTRMNEIMPYYNQLYKSQLIKFNPLWDTDLTSEKTGSGAKEGSESKEVSKEMSGETNETGNRVVNDERSRVSEEENKSVGVGNESGESGVSANRSGSNSGSNSSEAETMANESGTRGQLDKYSDTPQGSVSNLVNGTYLTNAREIGENNAKNTLGKEKGSGSSSEEYSETSGESRNESRSSLTKEDSSGKRNESENGSANEINKVSGSNSQSGSETSNSSNFVSSTESYLEKVVIVRLISNCNTASTCCRTYYKLSAPVF